MIATELVMLRKYTMLSIDSVTNKLYWKTQIRGHFWSKLAILKSVDSACHIFIYRLYLVEANCFMQNFLTSQADSCHASQDILRLLWNQNLCRLCYCVVFHTYGCFGDTCCFYHQGGSVHCSMPANSTKSRVLLIFFLLNNVLQINSFIFIRFLTYVLYLFKRRLCIAYSVATSIFFVQKPSYVMVPGFIILLTDT